MKFVSGQAQSCRGLGAFLWSSSGQEKSYRGWGSVKADFCNMLIIDIIADRDRMIIFMWDKCWKNCAIYFFLNNCLLSYGECKVNLDKDQVCSSATLLSPRTSCSWQSWSPFVYFMCLDLAKWVWFSLNSHSSVELTEDADCPVWIYRNARNFRLITILLSSWPRTPPAPSGSIAMCAIFI